MQDYKGTEIELDQIVQHENLKTDEVNYFHVCKGRFGYLWLLKYDKQGKTKEYSLGNIKVDPGIELINNEASRWSVLGSEEEVYSQIFFK